MIDSDAALFLLGMERTLPYNAGEWTAAVFFGFMSMLLAVGWLERFVPFVPDADQTPASVELVSETKPAIELRWLHGPVLLDFDDDESRDHVYAELVSWRRGPDR